MKRFMVLSGFLALFVFMWGCSERADFSTQNSLNSDANEQAFSKSGNGFNSEATYEVIIENLTPATGPGASQPMSPAIIATHANGFKLFNLGQFASDELRQVAEDAVNDPILDLLGNSSEVNDYGVILGSAGPIFPGETAEFEIKSDKGFTKLSLVSMLVNTNDGFVGANHIQLPNKGSKEFYLRSYDAGTEKNTELEDHIPGPCCGNAGVRVPTEERIRFHDGILGVGDLDPAVYDWEEPAAKLTITKID